MDSNWAPGFRFHPTEEELISFYLRNKLEGTRLDLERVIPTLDIYSMDPRQLPQFSGELCREDLRQWFFFVPRQARDALGGRTSRTTSSGYWKATGSPSYAYSSGSTRIIGVKKSMVFYEGKVPTGKKTEWKMNEYRAFLADQASSTSTSTATPNRILRHEYSLCRVYVGLGRFRAFGKRSSGVTRSEMPMQLHQPDACASEVGASSTIFDSIPATVPGNMVNPSHYRQKTPKMQKTGNKSDDWSTSGDGDRDGDDAYPPQTVWDIIDDGLQSLLELDWKNFIWD